MAFACMGISGTPIAMMEVTERPRRTIPLGILLSALVVGAIYALMGTVASGVLPVEQVAGQNLSVVAQTIFPHGIYEVYAGYFTSKPVRSCVAVKALPKGALCEIEAIAVK